MQFLNFVCKYFLDGEIDLLNSLNFSQEIGAVGNNWHLTKNFKLENGV